METLNKNRKIIWAIVIIVLAFFLYNFLAGSEATPAIGGSGLATNEANTDLLRMATELAAVDYKSDLFSTPGYQLLVDFSVPLASQPTGRSNPFDIIGRD